MHRNSSFPSLSLFIPLNSFVLLPEKKKKKKSTITNKVWDSGTVTEHPFFILGNSTAYNIFKTMKVVLSSKK